MKVKVHFRLDPIVGTSVWCAEADPVVASRHSRVYRLTVCAPVVPIVPGDLVRAEEDEDGLLWMTDFVEFRRASTSMISPHPGSPEDTWARWSHELAKLGGSPYIHYPMVLCAWPRGESEERILDLLARVAPEAMTAVAYSPQERQETVLWLTGLGPEPGD